MTSAEVRADLVDALQLDLVGPTPEGLGDSAEWLDQAPSRWYLTGFLVPAGAGPSQARDAEAGEDALETAEPAEDSRDETPRKRSADREHRLPSSAGLTVLLPESAQHLRVYVTWGDYRVEAAEGISLEIWKRAPHSEPMELDVSLAITPAVETEVPRSDGLWVALLVRPLGASWFEAGFSADAETGAKTVSVFLVNRRRPADTDGTKDRAFAFQARLELQADQPFMALPGIRSLFAGDWDEEVAELQYRDCGEYSIGHNVSTEAYLNDGVCGIARTCWTPRAEVERIEPLLSIPNVELSMSVLGGLVDGTDAWAKLSAIPAAYRTQWVEPQRARLAGIAEPKHRDTAEMLLNEAEAAARRIERGIEVLNNPQALQAFCIANRAMSDSAVQMGGALSNGGEPRWYPFQLAFILMNLEGIVSPGTADRSRVDLLCFPPGGGKTEACLGLAAFTLVLRRLLHSGITGAGASVIVRHTLRLPPPARIARAAAMICSLELIRQADVKSALGDWPFEIGLWDSKPPAPDQGASSPSCATEESAQAHFPLETCPWCGTAFNRDSFETAPAWKSGVPRVKCASNLCPFNGRDRWLPIVSSPGFQDQSICRRLPCLVMATADKFAAFPWHGRIGALFGKVDRYDRHGFYGPCDPGVGSGLPGGRLLPFDLLVQEDMDSLSGPLGSILGLYESVTAELSANGGVRPKIVSSTTTVRKASAEETAAPDAANTPTPPKPPKPPLKVEHE